MSLDFFMCRFGHSYPGQLQFHKIIFFKNYEFSKVFKPCKFPFRNQLIRGPLDSLTLFRENLLRLGRPSKAGSHQTNPQPPSLFLSYVKFVSLLLRDLKPSNFEWSGNLLSFSSINGQLVKWLLKDSIFMSE